MRALVAALFGASLVLCACPSAANARFPLSQRFFQDQANPDRLFLSATFGLLISRDRGQNWYHVCESALTPELIESDILFEVMPDGGMLTALVQPLQLSTDCGCTWQPVLGEDTTEWVVDIAKAGSNSVVALVRSTSPSVYRVERSTDSGRTWSSLSELSTGLQAYTLDVAASDPMRVYVSATLIPSADAGITESTPALLVSDDGGTTWVTRPVTGAPSGDQPFIAAVHPDDADRVFVRTDNWVPNDDTGLDDASDALFYSDDAGVTFRELLRKGAKLFGFALSPDGSTVLAGYGDPVQATRYVYPEEVGIYRASTTDFAFTLALNSPVSCLTWNGTGLYACLDDIVGVSPNGDVPTTVDGFTPILVYDDVRGPLACNAAACLPDWQEGREDVASVCARLSAVCDVDTTANVLMCSSSTGGAGGMGGTGGLAGSETGGGMTGGSNGAGMGGPAVSGQGGASATGTGGAAPASGRAGNETTNDDSAGSCGCRSPRAIGSSGTFAALAVIVALGLRRRRRSA
jgi:MYXO-CTERM domain-containing protein